MIIHEKDSEPFKSWALQSTARRCKIRDLVNFSIIWIPILISFFTAHRNMKFANGSNSEDQYPIVVCGLVYATSCHKSTLLHLAETTATKFDRKLEIRFRLFAV
jgi:hypothetical protein